MTQTVSAVDVTGLSPLSQHVETPQEAKAQLGRTLSSLPEEQSDPPTPNGTQDSPGTRSLEITEMKISSMKGAVVIITLAGTNLLNSMGSGILIAALSQIAKDVGLPDNLILWPAAVYALSAGCLLLIFGAAADVLGAKSVWVTGSFLYMVLTLALGLAKTGLQVILIRCCLGIAISMCLPTAMSLITNTFPRGHWRNVAFAMNGMGAPLGYAVGLVLGGIFTDTIGWRWAYYIMALINASLSMASIWSLPAVHHPSDKKLSRRLIEDIDWVGAALVSVALGIFLYVLSVATSSYRRIDEPQNISMLVVSMLLLGSFPFWMRYRTQRGLTALIPNHVWKNASFTSICIAVFLCWACLTGIEYFSTLYFQQVQQLSALQSSIRFIPHVVMGASVNIATAYLITRVKIQRLALVSGVITMIAPILMATITIDENYWFAPFWALFLSPVSGDVLFTVSNLVISDVFPPELQSLAGGIFNEVSQLGNSVGLAVTAAIAASVTDHQPTESHKEALMSGYRAAFWTMFAGTTTVALIVLFGLRSSGVVGMKRD